MKKDPDFGKWAVRVFLFSFFLIVFLIPSCKTVFAEETAKEQISVKPCIYNFDQRSDGYRPVCSWFDKNTGINNVLEGRGYIEIRICGETVLLDIECPVRKESK